MQKLTKNTLRLVGVTIAVGICSGLGGMLLALLLHYIQHIAFGYSLGQVISPESFLEGVEQSSPLRRVIALTICGIIAGCGWYLLYRFGKPIISIKTALGKGLPIMPFFSTMIHALLQIITVALGSPLGREVAPREVGALFASNIARNAGCSPEYIRIFVACGAGAGLAAVYNVPIGGALFVLEVLLQSFSWQILIPAFSTSLIAVLVAWMGLGNHPQYILSELRFETNLLLWSVVAGAIMGFVAHFFIRLAESARQNSARHWQLIVFCLINFIGIGVLAIYFPALLGNGRSPAQLEFDGNLALHLSVILFLLRTGIVWSSLRAGACGGLLTPSLANGALLGAILGYFWSHFFPDNTFNTYALVGAAAFLAAAQKMPLTAVVLLVEFTRMPANFLMPVCLAVIASVSVFGFMGNKRLAQKEQKLP